MSLSPVLHDLQCVQRYHALCSSFSDVEGFLTDFEGYALNRLAAGGPGDGAIVEIGSFKGRSTLFLADGAREAGSGPVTAIDHFSGSPEHQPGQLHEIREIREEGTTFGVFSNNIVRKGYSEWVNVINASSADAAGCWTSPIRLLFIDGDHSYEMSKQDFELFERFICADGLVVFHDIKCWPGVTQFYNEVINGSRFRHLFGAGTLGVTQKVA